MMRTDPDTGAVTHLLRAWSEGDGSAADRLFALVYEELRHRAAIHLRKERTDHTLQPTALVHEAYLRFVGQRPMTWQNRGHFYGIASRVMRRILVEHARSRQAAKRPPPQQRATFDEHVVPAPRLNAEVLFIDEALTELFREDARQAQIVEMRYFGGLTEHEVARALNISRATVTREWQSARAWLYKSLTRSLDGTPREPQHTEHGRNA